MQLLLFLFIKRAKNFFSIRNWKSILGITAFFILMQFNAFVAGYLYNHAVQFKGVINPVDVLRLMESLVLLMPVVFKFFPSFASKKIIISNQYPVNKIQIILIDLFGYIFFKSVNISLLSAIFIFSAFAHCGSVELYNLLLFFLTGFLLAESIVNAITWNKMPYLFGLIIISALILYLLYDASYLKINKLMLCMILVFIDMLLLIAYYIFYENRYPAYYPSLKLFNSLYNAVFTTVYLKIAFKNSIYRKMLAIGFILKIGILILYITQNKISEAGKPFLLNPIVYLFISPLILFTYIYNNLWGYFKSTAINISLAKYDGKDYFLLFIKLLFPALFIDAFCTFLILFLYNQITYKVPVAYIMLSLLYIVVGYITSLLKFSEVTKVLSLDFKGNTSQVSALLVVSFAFGMSFASQELKYFYLYNVFIMTIRNLEIANYISIFV
ncbi:hypothetical protein [Parafilimonas sp.]|uniref:hypothetical protein n=1 Tax=Parafilimonas sp. TaxID=1969739 RepID=UPI0039E22AB3